jgi:hypothetical protein
MIQRTTIENILNYAVMAPSGGNSQPWRFEIYNNELRVFALPEKDHAILNFRHRGTWVAHGALLENIVIISNHLGQKALVSLSPVSPENNLVATIQFSQVNLVDDPLFYAIPRRATNRKKYSNQALTDQQRNFLLDGISNNKAILLEDLESRNQIGEALSRNEIITFENKDLHRLMFKEMIFTEDEEKKRMSGLYLKTMELKPSQEKILRLLRNWNIANLLNKFGLARLIAKDNIDTYASGSVLIAVVANDDDQDFISAGRITQRIWLRAVSLGFSGHIISGIPFLWQRLVLGGDNKTFSPTHQDLIKNSYSVITRNFNVKNGIISLILRIGQSESPTALSSKMPPNIKISNGFSC